MTVFTSGGLHPFPCPSSSMYILSPKLCKSRCGPEGSVCFICLHSDLRSLHTVSDPHAMYSQREPHWSMGDPTTSGAGRDAHVCAKDCQGNLVFNITRFIFSTLLFYFVSLEILIVAYGVFKSGFVRKLLTSHGLPA